MPRYIRSRVEGGTYFFTVVTYQRRQIFVNESIVGELRNSIQAVRQAYPFSVEAWVLLPDHMHCIWTLPKGDNDFSKRMGMIKAGFASSAGSLFHGAESNTPSRIKHRESTIWQRRFWEHEIRNEEDFIRHMDYVHYNPVKHGLVKRVCDWPYSTFHRYVENGVYARHWAADVDFESERYGE